MNGRGFPRRILTPIGEYVVLGKVNAVEKIFPSDVLFQLYDVTHRVRKYEYLCHLGDISLVLENCISFSSQQYFFDKNFKQIFFSS